MQGGAAVTLCEVQNRPRGGSWGEDGNIVAALDPEMFWQIHRSTIVNINAVASVRREIGGRLSLRLKARKETLTVSERYSHRFTIT